MESKLNIDQMTPEQMAPMIARTSTCLKTGIVDDNGEPYLVLFKTGKSKKPLPRYSLNTSCKR